jgi:hypothetical protein
MKFLGRMVRRVVRLTILAAVFTVVVVVLDAALSPDGPEQPR